MRVWVPFPNFAVSAFVLHERELRESLKNARDVQRCLQGTLIGYDRDVNVRAWDGCLLALMMYGDCMVRELAHRGLRTREPTMITRGPDQFPWQPPGYRLPEWVGDFHVHEQHRRHLGELKRDGWYDRWQW